eukprot:778184-Karenia_brevis.AAC.1
MHFTRSQGWSATSSKVTSKCSRKARTYSSERTGKHGKLRIGKVGRACSCVVPLLFFVASTDVRPDKDGAPEEPGAACSSLASAFFESRSRSCAFSSR